MFPLRDCVWQEITRFCQLDRFVYSTAILVQLLNETSNTYFGQDSLKTMELARHPQSGINDLVSSFVALLQVQILLLLLRFL